MVVSSSHSDVSASTVRLIIGVIAISLPFLTNWLAGGQLPSISASYYAGDWPRNIFVGFLIAISALLLSYNGNNYYEFVISKIGAVATFLIATFPEQKEGLEWVHGLASFIMFTVLALFCFQFYKSARDQPSPQSTIRATIYLICGITIILSMLAVILKSHIPINRLTFYAETIGLLAFGLSWLISSRILPVVTAIDERIKLMPFTIHRGS